MSPTDYRLLIAGRLFEGVATREVINPAREQAFVRTSRADAAQAEEAIAADAGFRLDRS